MPAKTASKTTSKKSTSKKTTGKRASGGKSALTATMKKVAAEDAAKAAERAAVPEDAATPATTPRAAKGGRNAGKAPAKPNAATRAKRAAHGAGTAKPPARPKAAAKPSAPRRTSALDAAADVLAKSGKEMGTREMIELMGKRGLWTSPGGKTPHATLYSAIAREIAVRGSASRFRKTGKGVFAASGKRG